MVSERKQRASLYIRLSREAGTSNLSLDGMMNDVRDLAARLGYAVAAEHVDNGISGAVRDRPEFTAWLEDARSGKVDALLTYHADRLTREGVNAAALVFDVLEGKDPSTGKVVRTPVRLVDCHGLDSQDEDAFRWRFVIAAEVARSERQRIKARNLATKKRLNAAGRFAGGSVPYGCKVIMDTEAGGKVLVENPDEAKLLRAVGEKLIAGLSTRGAVRWLNAQGSRTRRGLEWQRSSLRQTLLSEASKTHVFDLATHRALKERLSPKPAEKPVGGRPRTYLLAGGQSVCGSCGRKMTTGAGRYICSSSNSGEPCPTIVTIKAPDVDAYVAEKFLGEYAAVAPMEDRTVIVGAADLDAAERAVEAAEKALLADLTAENMAAVQKAREDLALAQSQPQQRVTLKVPMTQTVAELWEVYDAEERASLLASVLAKPVVISPNPGGRPKGRQKVDVEGRLDIAWQGAPVAV